MERSRALDLIVFGATGFTGRLVAEVLQRRIGAAPHPNWAIAGRDATRLAAVRDSVGAGSGLPLLLADAADPAALAALVAQARVVITTVGPYQHHGEALVSACAQAGTDYVDLCGEPGWMAQMIPKLEAPARNTGARIVFSCGFDSVPFDLGVVFLQQAALQRFGAPLSRVRGRVKVLQGGPSGGTIASGLASFEAMGRDPLLARAMADPFALTPGFRGPAQPDGEGATYDAAATSWTGPFVMAPINTKNLHRTNALRGHPWGRDFEYDERMLTGDGPRGERRARALARNSRIQNALLGFGPARALLRRFVLPKPGEGPGPREREAGRYELLFSGETAAGQTLAARVTGDRDPGYGSTSKIVTECALCLLEDIDRGRTAGGVWTAGAAMGLTLLQRLREQAGLTFELVEAGPGALYDSP